MRKRGGSAALAVLRARDGRPRVTLFSLLVAAGFAVLLLSWLNASSKTRYDDQLAAVDVGVVGTTIVLASCALYLVMYRRTVRARVGRLRSEAGSGSVR